MKIEYENSKEVKCYRDFVLNPEDRSAINAFKKCFGADLMTPAVRLHSVLVEQDSVGMYNKIYGSSDNRIEVVAGVPSKCPKVFKVRISRSYRKFFQQIIKESGSVLLVRDWNGDFDSIDTIRVVAVNKHDYRGV